MEVGLVLEQFFLLLLGESLSEKFLGVESVGLVFDQFFLLLLGESLSEKFLGVESPGSGPSLQVVLRLSVLHDLLSIGVLHRLRCHGL